MNKGGTDVRITRREKGGRPGKGPEDPVNQAGYDPANLLGALSVWLNLDNDAALACALGVAPPVISKVRHHSLPVGACLLVRMHELSGLSIRELRCLMQADAGIVAGQLAPDGQAVLHG